ncbi:MAG: AAA family ATPase [Chloroflexi bacterium]|nr:AAA family ATPase [Chloroflexota bacterium]MDA1226557.1 AAA family ATPase [Chloroflexota bacterium]
MPPLNTITIKGFKSMASVENLNMKAINLLIGPNGSGKSNFVGVFDFLRAIRDGHLEDYVATAGGANRLLHFGSKTTTAIEVQVSFNDDQNHYKIELRPTVTDGLIPYSESVYYWHKQQYPDGPQYAEPLKREGNEAGISRSSASRVAYYVRKDLDSWRIYHFHDTGSDSPIKRTADINDNRFLRPDGSNLAGFLYYLGQKEPESYQFIRRTVQQVAPFFDDFQLEPQRLNTEKVRLEWSHRNSDDYFDASSLSDGTLRFIALTTLFLQPKRYRPSVILVDEPELGLHPYAIGLLASLIQQVSIETQVIVSTQSPILLNYFEPEDVLVADCVDGRTEFRRLESEGLVSWLEEYSLGELWEKNELGGRPQG